MPVLLLVVVLVGALIGLRFLDPAHLPVAVMALVGLFAAGGVFFLLATVGGFLRVSSEAEPEALPYPIADVLDDACVVVEDERILHANPAYQKLFLGAPPQTVTRLFEGNPNAAEALYRLAQAVTERRQAAEDILSMPGADATRYRVSVKPLGPRAALWIIREVSGAREHPEHTFHEVQHAVDYLDHAPGGFFAMQASGSIVHMNATLADWLGYDFAKVGPGGLDVRDVVVESAVAQFFPASGQVPACSIDTDLKQRNGTLMSVRLYHRIVARADGAPGASRILVVPRAVEPVVVATPMMDEESFAGFFNTMPIAIATVTASGEFLWTNSAFTQLFDTQAKPERRHIGQWIAPEQRVALDGEIAQAAAGHVGNAPLELGVASAEGGSARVWVRPATTASGGAVAILYAIDTTEFRQVEEQLAQAQKMNAIGQLAGGVAHDFNNVLQAIFGYCDLLLSNHRPTDPAFPDILQIKQNANRAASLVRQLLAFSRRQTLLLEALDLSDRLTETGETLTRVLGERVAFDFRHGRDLWPVWADFHQLEQVMINLAINARDAMPDGGKLTMRTENIPADEVAALGIAGMPNGDYVLIETTDTGTGMPPEILRKIFEPFFTTKDMGKGTGLGLSSAFGTIKQFGGFIDVRSAPGEGTTFYIYLPRHIAREADKKAEPSHGAAATATAMPAPDMTGQGVILLVEDEDPVRAVSARALTARGYTVLEAASGVEALQIVSESTQPIDLVISDVMMPDMNGPVLLRELRKRHADLKVIFVSGYAEEAFRNDLPEGENFTFLPKPFGLKQLVETVKQVMWG